MLDNVLHSILEIFLYIDFESVNTAVSGHLSCLSDVYCSYQDCSLDLNLI